MKIKVFFNYFLLVLFMALTLVSCKDKEIIPEPPDSDDFYFIATVNDKSKNLVSGRNGYRSTVVTDELTGNDPDLIKLVYSSGLSQLNDNYYIKSSEAASIIYDNNWFVSADYNADPVLYFNTAFATGSRVFCSQTDSVTPCIEIYWKDTYAKDWTSRSGAQPGSQFTITSVTESTGSSGETLRLVKATFNCNLYNEVGTAIELKNGQIFLIFKRA